jgi:hypothetical protein
MFLPPLGAHDLDVANLGPAVALVEPRIEAALGLQRFPRAHRSARQSAVRRKAELFANAARGRPHVGVALGVTEQRKLSGRIAAEHGEQARDHPAALLTMPIAIAVAAQKPAMNDTAMTASSSCAAK